MHEIKEHFGIVVLMDALGVQNATISESKHFVNSLKSYADGVFHFLSGYAESADLREYFKKVKPATRTFGDTFLITWAIPNESNIIPYLAAISSAVSSVVIKGIDQGILFRGAISIGKYLESDTTVIGPAITDAASWHEQANWFGCITTPNCTQRVNAEALELNQILSLKQYNVPLKSQERIELWCVDWPSIITFYWDIDPLKWYYQCVSKLTIPFGTEKKYINAEEFLKYSLSKTT